MKGCSGCARYRAALNHASCEAVRLCSLIDVTLIGRHDGQPLAYLQELKEQITIGGSNAARYAENLELFPQPVDLFFEHLRRMHAFIFERAEPNIAGRLRNADESAWFGGEGSHGREGVAGSEIEVELSKLYRVMPKQPAGLSRSQFTRWAAQFLERFFMIHPFVDGNGRVARLTIDWVARSSDKWRIRQDEMNKDVEDRYLGALEYAHRHVPENADTRCRPDITNPCRLLDKWVDSRLVDIPVDWRDFVPPETKI